jgi:hypothetical protein
MAASRNGVRLWTSAKVPFQSIDDHPFKLNILLAMAQIEEVSRVWFCQRGDEPNYLKFTNNSGSSHSSIGMVGGEQIINVNKPFIPLHEIMHAIGFIHEQQRSDRDTYVTIQWGNICNGQANGNFLLDLNSNNLTDYDRRSVMHYPAPATGWQGCPPDKEVRTMLWNQDPNERLGPDMWENLSNLDCEGIQKLYTNVAGWSVQSKIEGVATRQDPALAEYNGRLYAAWNGYHNDGIFFASMGPDGCWTGQSKIEGVATKTGPALAEFNGKLYAAWNGYHNDGIFFASMGADGKWSGQSKIEGVATKTGPALAEFNGKLYAAWNGYHNDGIFFASMGADGKWSGQSKIEGVATQHSPALAVFNEKLYAAWNGYHDDGIFFASMGTDGRWSAQSRMKNYGTRNGGPGLAVFKDPYNPTNHRLFFSWRGSGDAYIWWATMDTKESFSGQARIKGVGTQMAPSLAVYNDRLYAAWNGYHDDGIFYANFTV